MISYESYTCILTGKIVDNYIFKQDIDLVFLQNKQYWLKRLNY